MVVDDWDKGELAEQMGRHRGVHGRKSDSEVLTVAWLGNGKPGQCGAANGVSCDGGKRTGEAGFHRA